MFYNGWTHDHYVSSVLVFCPDQTIPICCYNVSGSIHNSCIAKWGGVSKKLEEVHERCGRKCTVDLAFNMTKYGHFMIKSSNNDPLSDNPNNYCVNKEVTSMRQSAKWGMRMLQSSLPKLKD